VLYRAIAIEADTASTYAHLADACRGAGRSPRRRMMDLWIAATAVSQGLPLYTRNGRDFAGLTGLLTVHVV
jgi:predicted nucleic acid-binding protein